MAKPEPYLLDPARYPWRHDLATRYQDIDPNHHINNVASAALFEDLRVRLDLALGMRELMIEHDRRTLIASVSLEYLGELFYPDPVEGHCGVLAIGRSSWTVAGLLIQNGHASIFGRGTIVCLAGARPAPLPDSIRRALETVLIPPEPTV